MKVFAWIFYKINSSSQAVTRGDIVYFYPINTPQGSLTMDSCVPLTVDITIPCGNGQVTGMDFAIKDGKHQYRCNECPYDNPTQCDVQKYTKGIWGEGTVLDPPRMIKKRRWSFDLATHIGTGPLWTLVTKWPKTEAEKTQILEWSQDHVVSISNVLDKVT